MEQKKTVYYEPEGVIAGSTSFAVAVALVLAYQFSGYKWTLTEVLLFGIFTLMLLVYAKTTFDSARREFIDDGNRVTKTL